MAFIVKEFFADSSIQVPAGVTHVFYQFIDEPNNVQQAIQAPSVGNTFCLYNRIDGTVLGAGSQTGTTRPFGDGTTTQRTTPVLIPPTVLPVWRPVVCHSNVGGVQNTSQFLLNREGTGLISVVYAWGYNGFGELGLGDAITKTTPVGITPQPWHAIQGDQNCVTVLAKNGTAWAMGLNNFGQVGDNTTASRSTPTQVVGAHTFLQVQTRGGQTLGIDTSGQVWGWGQTPPASPYNVNRSTPVLCSGLPVPRDLAGAGIETNTILNYQYVLLGVDRNIWVWGTALTGSLGEGSATGTRTSPVQLTLPATSGVPDKVRTTRRNAGYLTTLGELVLWGENTMGAVGDGTVASRSTPTVIAGHRFIDFQLGVATANSTGTVLALKEDGTVWAWGKNLGTASLTGFSTPTQISTAGDRFIGIVNTSNNHFAIKEDGTLYARGLNTQGELGTGGTAIVTTLSQLNNLRTNGTLGGAGIARQIYGVDTMQMSGFMPVVPGQDLRVNLGPRPTINGMGLAQIAQLAPASSIVGYSEFFARKCVIGWCE